MRRQVLVRVILTTIGVVVWGYGTRFELSNARLAGIALLAVALLLRFAPRRWFGDDPAA